MDFKKFIADLAAKYKPTPAVDVDAVREASRAEGYEAGRKAGYEAGQSDGYAKGYDEGFKMGLEAQRPHEGRS